MTLKLLLGLVLDHLMLVLEGEGVGCLQLVPALLYEKLDQMYELVPSDFMMSIFEMPWMGTDLSKGFESFVCTLTSSLVT